MKKIKAYLELEIKILESHVYLSEILKKRVLNLDI